MELHENTCMQVRHILVPSLDMQTTAENKTPIDATEVGVPYLPLYY